MEEFFNEENKPEENENRIESELNVQETAVPDIEPDIEPKEELPETEHHFEEDFKPAMQTVEYSEVKPIEDYKPANKGLKVFALILAVIVLLTGSCAAGYFLGKSGQLQKSKVPSVIEFADNTGNSKLLSAEEIYEKTDKSIVGIVAFGSDGSAENATGIIISKDGYVITNDHIYAQIPSAQFKIYTCDGKEYDAVFVAGDVVSDVAVLKIKSGEFTPAVFADSEDVYYGQITYAIGKTNGADYASSITEGIISMTGCRVSGTSNYTTKMLQTTSPINPGSSGGALVNGYGQVIGITCSKLQSTQYENVGFAIPSKTAKRISDELISEGKVISRAKLGITYTYIDSVTALLEGYDYTGLCIASVSEDSGLYGIAEKDDIITEINGNAVKNDESVLDVIDGCSPGDKISITLVRNGKTIAVEAVLTANQSESSYVSGGNATKIPNNKSEGDGNTFDFPDGE